MSSKLTAIQNPNTKLGAKMKPVLIGLDYCHKQITAKTQAYHDAVIYDIVKMGLWFLKAKSAIGHGGFEDFKLATVANLGISERTIRNYMQAAENAGLTAESDPKEVEELAERQALHGVKPGDLYKLKPAEPEQPPPPPPPEQLVLALFAEWSRETDELVASRDLLDEERVAKITDQLHAALCKWTDCDWSPRPHGTANDAAILEDDQAL